MIFHNKLDIELYDRFVLLNEKLEKMKDKLFGLDDVERKKNFICIMSSTDTY